VNCIMTTNIIQNILFGDLYNRFYSCLVKQFNLKTMENSFKAGVEAAKSGTSIDNSYPFNHEEWCEVIEQLNQMREVYSILF
jgi:hypothetical protein